MPTLSLKRVFAVNVLISVTLLAAYLFAPDKLLRFNPQHGHTPATADDRFQGGESVAEIIYQGEQLQLHCDISQTYQWPYCEAMFERDKENGLAEVWINGTKMSSQTHLWRHTNTMKADGFWFYSYYNNRPDITAPPSSDQYEYYDKFRVSTSPITH